MDLTPRQKEIYDFIVKYREEREISPTLQETADVMGLSCTQVHKHVEACIAKGWLKRNKRVSRGVFPAMEKTKVKLDEAKEVVSKTLGDMKPTDRVGDAHGIIQEGLDKLPRHE